MEQIKNYISAALPTIEQSRDEYIGSVYGAATLATVASIATFDAIDMIREQCPQLEAGLVKKGIRAIEGTPNKIGQARMLTLSIKEIVKDNSGMQWMNDFGNSVNEYVSPQLLKFRNAIANCLGRYKGVECPNAAAMVIVAQSIAHEQAAYVERRAEKFTLFTVEMRDRCKRSVSWVLRTMSCRGIDHSLRLMAEGLLERHLPDGFDLLADQSVRIGCQAVLNIMANVDTWVFAREKAERLNK